ncbi:MAG TPA: PDZ domain-containing protein, partial [Nitrososphaerales archaeon]|nr:PDZ domain-containing protein [Nitrososphaerales archaeon]
IQFSAPINPGNSGGPLLDSNGDVVGITTAVVQSSQGVGFAIPSDTIMKEIPSLVTTGSYNQHSYLGIGGADMNYQLSQASRTNVTYGVLIENVVPGGPASNAGLRAGSQVVTIAGQQYLVGGDIIISINGTRIVNNDALATYLEEHTVSGQMVTLGIIRGGSLTSVNLKLGARPPIS